MKHKIMNLCIAFILSLLFSTSVYAKQPTYIDKEALLNSMQDTQMTKEEYNQYFYQGDLQEEGIQVRYATSNPNILYPASYDPRLENKVTSVKNQLPYGACWSYGAMGVAESALIKQEYEDATIDLSELQYVYQHWKDIYPDTEYTEAFNKGGSLIQVWEYMSQGIGPDYESVYGSLQDYTGTDLLNPTSKIYDLDTLYYASYSSASNVTPIKNLIKTYGGAAIGYYSSNAYYQSNPIQAVDKNYNNTGDSTYYEPYGIKMINHMVEIVGWDDNYPASNFKNQPSGNGAWLVKNSWGTDYLAELDSNTEAYLAENNEELAEATGYYWISYYEESMQNLAAVGVTFTTKNTKATDITVFEDNITLFPTQEYSIGATVLPTTATNQGLTYASSDESIAVVDSNGVITAKKKGNCTLTITSTDILDKVLDESWVKEEITVTVTNPYIMIEQDTLSLKEGDKYPLTVEVSHQGLYPLQYKIEDEDIVTIDKNQTLQAKKAGNTILTISSKAYPDITCTLVITVKATIQEATTQEITTQEATTQQVTTEESKQETKITVSKVTIKKTKRKKTKLYIKWKKVKSTGYQIQVATNSKYKKATKITIKKQKSSTYIKLPKRMQKAKHIYVRIRAYKTVKGVRKYGIWKKKRM